MKQLEKAGKRFASVCALLLIRISYRPKLSCRGLARVWAIDMAGHFLHNASVNSQFMPLVSSHRQLFHFLQLFHGYEASKTKQLEVGTVVLGKS